MKEQPLQIDYLQIQQAGAELPNVTPGFFEKIWFEIKCFIATFVEDYDSIGEIYEGDAIVITSYSIHYTKLYDFHGISKIDAVSH